MLPLILGCLAQQGAAFAGACRQLAAAQQAQQAQQVATAEAAVATAARDLEVALRLVARSGASLPLRGLEEQVCETLHCLLLCFMLFQDSITSSIFCSEVLVGRPAVTDFKCAP